MNLSKDTPNTSQQERIALLERAVRNQMQANHDLELENRHLDSCVRSLKCAVGELQTDRRQQIADVSTHDGAR